MDFKSMINKIESIDGPIETPKAPVLPAAVRLDEDTEFRVLAGLQPLTESLVMEKKLTKAEKEKKEEIVKSMKKDKADFKERYGEKGEEVMHATATKIAKKKAESTETNDEQVSEAWPGTPEYKAKHGSDKEKHMAKYGTDPEEAKEYEEKKKKGGYGNLGPSGSESDSEAPKKGKKSKKDESLDPKFLAKFESMVEAKKKDIKGKKAEEKMDEAKKPDEDGDGVPDWADKKPGEDDHAGKKKSGKKGMTAKQAKYFGKKNEAMDVKKKAKKYVKESIETQKLSFKDMMKLVVESGGQQQIDPLDKALFTWATRVAQNKLGEGTKSEVYAGLVYERMGGRFEMYDVLSEDQK